MGKAVKNDVEVARYHFLLSATLVVVGVSYTRPDDDGSLGSTWAANHKHNTRTARGQHPDTAGRSEHRAEHEHIRHTDTRTPWQNAEHSTHTDTGLGATFTMLTCSQRSGKAPPSLPCMTRPCICV